MANRLLFTDLPGSERARRFEGAGYGSTVSLFIMAHQPGTGPDLHRHPYEETFIVQEGRGTFTVGDETVEAEGGQIVIVPPNTPHKFVSSGDGPLRQVSVHPAERMEQEELE